MGASFSGRCYETSAEAAHAFFSGAGPVISTGSPPVVSAFEFDVTWLLRSYEDGVLIATVSAPSVAFGECDPGATYLDGLTLGWLVLGVWLAAWVVRAMFMGTGYKWGS